MSDLDKTQPMSAPLDTVVMLHPQRHVPARRKKPQPTPWQQFWPVFSGFFRGFWLVVFWAVFINVVLWWLTGDSRLGVAISTCYLIVAAAAGWTKR